MLEGWLAVAVFCGFFAYVQAYVTISRSLEVIFAHRHRCNRTLTCKVRQRGEGVEPVLMLISRPIQLTLEGGLPVVDTREHRIQSVRSGILALNWLGPSFLAAARLKERSRWVFRREGSTVHDETLRPSEEVLRKDQQQGE